ncbi:MAG: glycoside hydrolase family 2 [Clostridia bacterium]|nr:glycoside hydrolase family 2 [Clostridia bacterium]
MENLYTRWGKTLDREHPLSEYPRPQMKRASYLNLNGVWDYAILPTGAALDGYQGEIVVPFSPETLLSGVQRTVTPSDTLFYRRVFTFKKTQARVLLHIGAVDYRCEVRLNGKPLGVHYGGYTPFTFEITDAVQDGENELTLQVTDPSETGSQASGKQTSKRGQIWYTPQSGIWQTVWIEEVPALYVERLKLTPDIDRNELKVEVTLNGGAAPVKATATADGSTVAEAQSDKPVLTLPLENVRLWSPEDPYLYGLTVEAGDDRVESYFGMRKFSVGRDMNGTPRFFLNNAPYFHNGLLDQGYWSDGMYTAAHDDALIYDIQTMKDMGFNMLRKHIKIEPLRWYYHCDRLGMLVWQDMVNGGGEVNQLTAAALPGVGLALGKRRAGNIDDGKKNYKLFSREDANGRAEYYIDAGRMIDTLYNAVSIALWVPFNEGWGQFDAKKACAFFREKDPTRIIDHASGWHDQGAGDVNSFHIYFTPFIFPKFSPLDGRVIALTEFGGYSKQTPGHVFNTEKMFGYRIYKTDEALAEAVRHLYVDRIAPLIRRKGLSALVYTEVSDVEDETNGLLTYDREVVKIPVGTMREINRVIRL